MTARVIDGKEVARKLRVEYRARAEKLSASHGLRPGLVVILSGLNPASRLYVNNKVTWASTVCPMDASSATWIWKACGRRHR
jgi:5,10-methylene-tetrahydrofolate dehydrogenase/methenyl tetrahydrofolate cyclohydrolase